MLSVVIVGAIAVSVAIGYKTKYNTGLFAIVFAYLIGCFALGMKPKAVIAEWPVSTMFVIFSVSLFLSLIHIFPWLRQSALPHSAPTNHPLSPAPPLRSCR